MPSSDDLIRAVAKAACPGREPGKDDLWLAEIHIRALREVSPEVDMLLSDRDEDQGAIIRFEDAQRPDELFFGCGAHRAADRAYARLLDAWNCSLFVMVCSPLHASEVRRRIAAEKHRAWREMQGGDLRSSLDGLPSHVRLSLDYLLHDIDACLTITDLDERVMKAEGWLAQLPEAAAQHVRRLIGDRRVALMVAA